MPFARQGRSPATSKLSPSPNATVPSGRGGVGPTREKGPGLAGMPDKGGPGSSQTEARAGGPRPCQDPPGSPLICSSPCDEREVSRRGTSLDSGLAYGLCWPSPTDQTSPTLYLLRIWREAFHRGLPTESLENKSTQHTLTHTHTHTHTVPGAEALAQPDCSPQSLTPKKRAETK